jgi:hypothetical protein
MSALPGTFALQPEVKGSIQQALPRPQVQGLALFSTCKCLPWTIRWEVLSLGRWDGTATWDTKAPMCLLQLLWAESPKYADTQSSACQWQWEKLPEDKGCQTGPPQHCPCAFCSVLEFSLLDSFLSPCAEQLLLAKGALEGSLGGKSSSVSSSQTSAEFYRKGRERRLP